MVVVTVVDMEANKAVVVDMAEMAAAMAAAAVVSNSRLT